MFHVVHGLMVLGALACIAGVSPCIAPLTPEALTATASTGGSDSGFVECAHLGCVHFRFSLGCAASPCPRGARPARYRVVVTRPRPELDERPVADSGTRDTPDSAASGGVLSHVFEPGAAPLGANTPYAWRVWLWSAAGDDAAPAACAHARDAAFRTALLRPSDWGGAAWIGGGSLLKGTVDLRGSGHIVAAQLFFSALGCGSVAIDGVPVSDTYLDPGFSTVPPARVLYRALDVTALLRPGALHQVTVSLGMCKYGALGNTGAGVFCVGAHATTAACRAALVKVSVEFEEAAPREFVTSASSGAWAATTAGNPTVYTHLFHGEQYDSRRLGAGPEVWGPATAYDTAAHQQVGLGALSLHAVTEEVPAVSVRRVASAQGDVAYVFDFAANLAGVVRLRVPAALPAGTRLVLRHAELLRAEGGEIQNTYCGWPCLEADCAADGGNCANQTDVYIANGHEATWAPLHTYHGFRYMQLHGWPPAVAAPTTATATALYLRSRVRATGAVGFGHPLLSRIQRAVLRTQGSNLHSIPTDCPHREKRGWLGDAQWTSGQASLNFDMAAFYSNFMRSISDTMAVGCTADARAAAPPGGPARPRTYTCCSRAAPTFGCDWTGTNFSDMRGALPDVVPYEKKTYGGWPGDPSWHIAAAVIPWEAWHRTGELGLAREWYNAARAATDFLTAHVASDGLVQFGFYGDWLSTAYTPRPQVAGFSHILAVARMADLARALNKTADAARYTSLLGALKARYHAAFYNATARNYGASQAANVLSLFLDVPPDAASRAGAVQWLQDDLVARDYSLTLGALGARYVFRVLQDNGLKHIALAIATKRTRPSFGFMVRPEMPGTIWEEWAGDAYHASGSKNHPMFTGGIGLYLYELAGLDRGRAPGVPTFAIDGDVAPALGAATVSVRGYAMSWVCSGAARGGERCGTLAVNVTVPYGARAAVHLPLPGAGAAAACVETVSGDVLRCGAAASGLPAGVGGAQYHAADSTLRLSLDGGFFSFVCGGSERAV